MKLTNVGEGNVVNRMKLTRLGCQIKELCMLRDSPYDNFLSRPEAQEIIDVL